MSKVVYEVDGNDEGGRYVLQQWVPRLNEWVYAHSFESEDHAIGEARERAYWRREKYRVVDTGAEEE